MRPNAIAARILGLLIGPLFLAAPLTAAPVLLDACDDASVWTASASDGVSIHISNDEGAEKSGRSLRIDFDFQRGAGFCVFRRAIDLPIPPRYRFRCDIRGDAPSNNLELKLIDDTGDNVWWLNRRGFHFPQEWTSLTTRSREIAFAWGPGGGRTPLVHARAIEFAVAAGSGGKGTIWIDSLTFESLPEPPDPPPAPLVRVSSSASGAWPLALPPDGACPWRSAEGDPSPTLTLDLGYAREFGGLALVWASQPGAQPARYTIETSDDALTWRHALIVDRATSATLRDWAPIADAESRFVRLTFTARAPLDLRRCRVLDPSLGANPNTLWSAIAAETRPGLLPAYFRGLQPYWTILGASGARGDNNEALIGADASVEVDKLAFSIAPFLRVADRLFTAEDGATEQSLLEEELPIPTVAWKAHDWRLDTTAFVSGPAGASTLFIRYRLTNTSGHPLSARLFLTIRPFQVLPPTQNLNIIGGVSPIHDLALTTKGALINGSRRLAFLTPPSAVGATGFFQGEIASRLDSGDFPTSTTIHDPLGYASSAAAYDLALAPGESRDISLALPMHDESPIPAADSDPGAVVASALEETATEWRSSLNTVTLRLPPSAARIQRTFRSTLAYILINRDGAALQPGSRTYERTWIRDGALTATALLYTGHSAEVLDFLDWFAPFQFENGKVPCCVDARGPDPVTENDSHGQYLYLVAAAYRYTHDQSILARHMPHVRLAVAHLRDLIAQRSTAEYRDATGLTLAEFGLVPESISHEGYSAKPMHSYWDDFWTLRGLDDAHDLARAAGDATFADDTASLRDTFRESLSRSIALAMREKQIGFVPGCVELGDFDPTSTSIALFPLDVAAVAPEGAIEGAFDRYRAWFTDRARGVADWRDYTPYEIRNATSFLLLGQPDFAHEMLDFFFQGQRPQGWNHWAEIVWKDPRAPHFIGDMPHTWVGSDFLKLVRSMFVHETADTLHLALGIRPDWLDTPQGVEIAAFPTPWGAIGYHAHRTADRTIIDFDPLSDTPPAGVTWHSQQSGDKYRATADGEPAPITPDGQVNLQRLPHRLVIEPR